MARVLCVNLHIFRPSGNLDLTALKMFVARVLCVNLHINCVFCGLASTARTASGGTSLIFLHVFFRVFWPYVLFYEGAVALGARG